MGMCRRKAGPPFRRTVAALEIFQLLAACFIWGLPEEMHLVCIILQLFVILCFLLVCAGMMWGFDSEIKKDVRMNLLTAAGFLACLQGVACLKYILHL